MAGPLRLAADRTRLRLPKGADTLGISDAHENARSFPIHVRSIGSLDAHVGPTLVTLSHGGVEAIKSSLAPDEDAEIVIDSTDDDGSNDRGRVSVQFRSTVHETRAAYLDAGIIGVDALIKCGDFSRASVCCSHLECLPRCWLPGLQLRSQSE